MTAPTDLTAQLGRILTAARGTESRRAMATRVGLSDVALSHVEHGHANPTLDRVTRLGDTYGVRIALVDLDDLEAELDLILRGKLGAPAVPRRNAIRRLTAHLTR